jgi:hypothetical protein
MFVSRVEVSCFDSIHRESIVTGANAIASSVDGRTMVLLVLRTNRSRDGPVAMPGSIGFQSEPGASAAARASFLGPVRRSRYGVIEPRHESLACCRCAGVIVTCTSFSASANVAGVTGGPEPAAVPNVGGAPGAGVPAAEGVCAGFWPSRHAPATARSVTGAWIRN